VPRSPWWSHESWASGWSPREINLASSERARLDFVTRFDSLEEVGPRWSTLWNGSHEILSDFAERDTGLEPATFGLGSLGNMVQQGAPECTTPDFAADGAIQGAPECTIGADSGARSNDDDVPAVRIEEAIKALLAGDVETARRLLRWQRSAAMSLPACSHVRALVSCAHRAQAATLTTALPVRAGRTGIFLITTLRYTHLSPAALKSAIGVILATLWRAVQNRR
jgi:hypothetical protein